MPQPKSSSPANKRPKRVTLQDIAEVAGVQKMAVSNALNNTRSVAPATRERIQKIADELNYIPNFAARALSQGRTGIIAVVSGPTSENYYGTMVHLLEGQLSADDYQLMLLRTPREIEALVKATGNLAVDGAIAIDMLGLVDEFRAHPNVPCVSISTARQAFVDNVFVDLSQSVAQALQLMLSGGRQRIAYVATAYELIKDGEVRAATYIAQMQKAGRETELINLETDDIDEIGARFKIYIEKHGCPDALLCQNDDTAMSVFGMLREIGLSVPSDVVLVGCDGQRYMKYFDPPLSTIVQPMAEICDFAWQLLQRRIAEPTLAPQQATVRSKLVVRKSLGEATQI